jgi:hypothetical protein
MPGLVAIAIAVAMAPAALLVLMPLALGVPHIVNDVRFLVLPQSRRHQLLAAVACAALFALRAAAVAGGPVYALAAAEVAVVALWLVAAVGAAAGARAAAVAALVGVLVLRAPLGFIAAAAILHNLVTLVVWAVLVRSRGRVAVLLAVVVATVAVAAIGPSIASAVGGDRFAGMSLDSAARLLFPGAGPGLGRSLVVGFALMQAVHYAVWLRWIPRRIARPPLGRDLGRLGLALAAVALAAVVVAASVDLLAARTTYLAVTTFHIYLELVTLATRGARRWL